MSTDFGFKASDKDYYFVSYNTEDSHRVGEICKLLYKQGINIWYDEGIPHDSFWEGVLAEKISNCKEVILFITKGIFEKGNSRALNEIYTYKEYDLARIYEKTILIVLLDDISPKEDIPYPLISWWQEINPSRRQGVVSIKETPEQTAKKILREFGKMYVDAKNGWGPVRKMFSMKKPADYPVMNSIIDNPTIGDERAFLLIGKITKEKTNLSSKGIELEPGNRYLVYIYCHNACSSTFFDKNHQYSGAVTGLKLSSSFPENVSPDRNGEICAVLSADNTNPREVWATQKVTSSASVDIKLEGPAKIYNDWELNGAELPMALFHKSGTLLGTDKFNGIMFGEESHCIVTYVLNVTEKKHISFEEVERLSAKLDAHR